MTSNSVLHAMADAYSTARGEGRVPMAWTVNRAAELALASDPDLARHIDPAGTIEDKPWFGLLLTIVDDDSAQPRFTLDTCMPGQISITVGRADSGN